MRGFDGHPIILPSAVRGRHATSQVVVWIMTTYLYCQDQAIAIYRQQGGGSMSFVLRELDGAGLRQLVAQLHPIYRECFAAAPWNEPAEKIADFPARLARHTGQPGAYGWIAEKDGEICGAVYGWPAPAVLPAANAFDIAVRKAAPPDVAARLVAPAMVVAELMVPAARRGRGLGRELLARQVGDRPAWLATHPEAAAARLYERAGWQRRFSYQVEGQPLTVFTRAAVPMGR
ncbi:GNAT family N-acetyltransferase [Micromonospora sp. NPDC002389]|uniref:GNAT family N-acetyltransferase n=1 Tax=Micromonospora sp. NPDC002389 TaxID=3154272 RepID=UPI0033210226